MNVRCKIFLGVISAVVSTMGIGCTSTEVVDPSKDYEENVETITLSIACPDANKSTRADNDHILRYSAIMYEGKSIDGTPMLQRQEALASVGESNPTTITFVVPEGEYSFAIIGDYIPKGSIPNEEGLYDDVYYDTHTDPTRLFMLSFKNFKDSQKTVENTCINNENYDCFATVIKVNKGKDQVEKDINLPRIVSRISFVSNTEFKDEVEEITFSKFDFFYQYALISKTGSQSASSSVSMKKATQKSLSLTQENEIFFFYSLASDMKGYQLSNIDFTIKFRDTSIPARSFTTQSIAIQPISNYKIKVTGPFLSEPVRPEGPIILNLTADTDSWESSSITYN